MAAALAGHAFLPTKAERDAGLAGGRGAGEMLNGATISSSDLWHVKRVSPQTIVCADRIFRPYPMSDLFGNGGRGLLASHQLPKAWQQTTLANVRLHDFAHVNFLVSFVFFSWPSPPSPLSSVHGAVTSQRASVSSRSLCLPSRRPFSPSG